MNPFYISPRQCLWICHIFDTICRLPDNRRYISGSRLCRTIGTYVPRPTPDHHKQRKDKTWRTGGTGFSWFDRSNNGADNNLVCSQNTLCYSSCKLRYAKASPCFLNDTCLHYAWFPVSIHQFAISVINPSGRSLEYGIRIDPLLYFKPAWSSFSEKCSTASGPG